MFCDTTIELYPTLEEKAARLAFGLAKNHAFLDGNKRVATACMAALLRLNGRTFRPDAGELLSTMLGVADGSVSYEALDVSWFFKNGDSGSEFFSIVYIDNAGRNPLFYPDYILQDHNGDIWIIEAKGGQDKAGKSENIDRLAPMKFHALQGYVSRHPSIRMGFVRYDKKSQRLCINTEHHDEDLNTLWWKLLKEVL